MDIFRALPRANGSRWARGKKGSAATIQFNHGPLIRSSSAEGGRTGITSQPVAMKVAIADRKDSADDSGWNSDGPRAAWCGLENRVGEPDKAVNALVEFVIRPHRVVEHFASRRHRDTASIGRTKLPSM